MRATTIPSNKTLPLRYVTWPRLQDILALQGSPLVGAMFAIGPLRAADAVPLAVLLIGNVLLMTHVFMLNDLAGRHHDLADPNKAPAVFTARGVSTREFGAIAAGLLIASLILFSRIGAVTAGLALSIAILSAFYSLPPFHWKGRPFLNSAAHLCGGILHFHLGYSAGHALDRRGLVTATFFALIFAAGHLTQEIRDHEGDAVNDTRTNAVVFGPRRTFAASVILFTLAQLLFIVMALRGLVPRSLAAVVLLYPLQLYWSGKTLREGLTYASVSRLQRRYRALYAVIGIAIVATLLVA